MASATLNERIMFAYRPIEINVQAVEISGEIVNPD